MLIQTASLSIRTHDTPQTEMFLPGKSHLRWDVKHKDEFLLGAR